MKFAYMVYNGKNTCMITFNKASAKEAAKLTGGKIRFMSYSLYNYPACKGDITHGWDYPTFYAQSEELIF